MYSKDKIFEELYKLAEELLNEIINLSEELDRRKIRRALSIASKIESLLLMLV